MSESENVFESIMKSGSIEIESEKGRFYCLSIIGQIEGH